MQEANTPKYGISYCSNLKSITINSTSMPNLKAGFWLRDLVVYVPANMLETYKADAQWSKLTIEAI